VVLDPSAHRGDQDGDIHCVVTFSDPVSQPPSAFASNSESEEEGADRNPPVIAQYLERVRRAKERYGPNRVVKMNEIAWKDVQVGGKTIAPNLSFHL
jgi:hypothetical protein